MRSVLAAALLSTVSLLGLAAVAEPLDDITFPVAELGGCASREACATYCDDEAHQAECVAFGVAHGLVPDPGFPIAELGNCASFGECETFCEDLRNVATCVDVAEERGWMTEEEARINRQVLPFLEAGTTPGGCLTRAECDLYCQDLAHFEECLKFGLDSGVLTADQYRRARELGGVGPGGCQLQDCEAYCHQPANIQACVDFAVEHGLITPEEAEQARRFAAAGGQGPGGCMDEASCRAYCENPEAFTECVEFAHDMGAMSDEEYERALASGPGGSQGGQGSCGGAAGYPSPQCDGIPQACKDQGMDGNQCNTYCQSNPGPCGFSGETSGTGGPPAGSGGSQGGGCGGASGYPSPQCDGIPQACRDQNMDGNQCQTYCQSNPQACGPGASPTQGPTGSPGPSPGGQAGQGGCGGSNGYPSPQCDGIPQACRDQNMDGNQCQAYCQQNPQSCEGSRPS